MRRISLVVGILMFVTASLCAQNSLQSVDLDRRVNELLQRMTLEEKIGQLVQCSSGAGTGPGTPCGDHVQRTAKGQIGSFLNVTGATDTNTLQRAAVEQSRLKIPLLFGLDVIHGYHTVFPVPLGIASTWDPELAEQAARVAAREAARDGVRWTFSPMVDIARDARWGRIVEGAGEDPYLGSLFAAAYVRGYQGKRLSSPDSIAACAKHFVAYGAVNGGRDYNPVDISEWTLRQIYLPPFHAAVDAGAATLMSAFNSLNGVPASANSLTLTKILRQEWGFRGFVVSDWASVGELVQMGVANDPRTAAKKGITAGVDMDMQSNAYGDTLAELVRSGAVSQSVLDESVRRILRVKFALGLFENPYTPVAPQKRELDAADVTLARTIAERSLVLLRNEPVNGAPLLPLQAANKAIAVIGPLGDSAVDMLGSWSGKGSPTNVVTLKKALTERLQQSGGHLLYARGTGFVGEDETGFAEALNTARQADIIIAALGEEANGQTGEAASRVRLDLPGNQQKLLEQLVATGKPVVLVVFSRPLTITWAATHVPAIVQAWHPGVQAGPALVRSLLGDVNFSGKLTVSVPRAVGQEPLFYNHLNIGRPADSFDLTHPPRGSGEKFVSRYIDELNAPLYPFGYGLSYTTFKYSPVQLSGQTLSARALNGRSGPPPSAGTAASRERSTPRVRRPPGLPATWPPRWA
jgi:beta-glucosidase